MTRSGKGVYKRLTRIERKVDKLIKTDKGVHKRLKKRK